MTSAGRQFCEDRCNIAAYLDGELSADRELSLEMHLAECPDCCGELNLLKQLLLGLDEGLRSGTDIDLPKDFAKIVAANAESTVAGLRRPRERFNALYICGALGLFVLLSFSVSAGSTLFFRQIAAVSSFLGHFFYDVCLGIVVILRAAASHFRSDVISTFFTVAVVTAGLYLFKKLLSGRLRI